MYKKAEPSLEDDIPYCPECGEELHPFIHNKKWAYECLNCGYDWEG